MGYGKKVAPRKTVEVRQSAHELRDILNIKGDLIPIVEIMELFDFYDVFTMDIVEKYDMPCDYGLYIPGEKTICIREDMYDNARKGDGFGRSTMAHELGHWFLGHTHSFSKSQNSAPMKTIEDPEWQANKFAQEFLIDTRLISSHISPKSIENRFGVTFRMAEVAHAALRREAIIK